MSSDLDSLRFDSNSSTVDTEDSSNNNSKEDSSLDEKGEEVCEPLISASTLPPSTRKEETLNAHRECHPNLECNIPNIEDFNYNSSDSQDYLESDTIKSDVKTSDKSRTVEAPGPNSIEIFFLALNPL